MQTATLQQNQNTQTESKKDSPCINVGNTERIASGVTGGLLAACGLKRGGFSGLLTALVGGALIYRGYSGQCSMYKALGINTAKKIHPANRSVHIEKSVVINKPVEEIFRFWRNLENLPRFMDHLEAVQCTSAKRSHWKAKGPVGNSIEWDAEIINEIENELIAWTSLEGATVYNAGSVHFERVPEGTHLKVVMDYTPPGGKAGAGVVRLLGEAPELQIEEDLKCFKQMMESGDYAHSYQAARV